MTPNDFPYVGELPPESWAALADSLFTPQRLAEAPAMVEGAVALAGIAPGAAVLDLPCGPGRHALELARRGFRVTAVDGTERYVARARAGAEEAGLPIEFVCADMRAFRREGAFDAVLNLYTSFGYFDEATNAAIARGWFEALRPGGALVIDVVGKEWLASHFVPRFWNDMGGRWLLSEASATPDWSHINNRWMVVDPAKGQTAEVRFRHWLYSAAELVAILRAAGFAECAVHGSLAGGPYSGNAARLVVVARRA